ncbi:cytochrome-c oxidase, cbb3-type subunit I [Ruegeria faecimaris]|uniref:cytochrome-c oxidase n=1 Tax=Ruegeria faecimaris TaxID=686389 RepID=A0A521DNS2_9RHOB|nr:cytochrome-c oxidase, cbb3-type subunit I [Ruegeria faecimaris]SMO73346.1 cytochrome c oxidase cbb3-type subunit 1 [Ruegeria faecimaris]
MQRESFLEDAAVLCALALIFVGGVAILGWGVPTAYVLHGWLIAIAAGWGLMWMINRLSEAPKDIPLEYNDKVIRFGVIAALIWAIIGFTVGDILAWQLAFPALNGDMFWSNFGRLRPVHTSAVIFGFGGNALIATSFYVVQRTSRARLASESLPWMVFWGYNLFMVLAATGYPLGITQSKEYAEPEWYMDLVLLIVWVGYLGLYLKTLSRRAEPHIYVANWYYLAFIVVIAMLHTVNNLSVPVSIAYPKSYSLFSGTQDAMTQWWYGHNAVGFLLTAGFLGMLYYFLPKAVNRPIYSYRMSIVGFWGITFLYLWAGSHHLHYTALPDWVQYLGMTMSIILLVPSWASVFNGILTINGAWDKVRTDPAVRFMMVAILFYGLSTFEGSFMAIRPVNSLSHYTDWTVGHVHAGALGWVAFITFGAMYKMVPWIWKRDGVYSLRLEAWHFWLALSGTLIYVGAMWNSGITQSLMWQTYDADGAFLYSFLDSVIAMHPYYVARAIGGLLYLIGACIGAYNIYMTVSGPRQTETRQSGPLVQPAE